jgi:hypothetical protein
MKYVTIPEDICLGKDEAGKEVFLDFPKWLASTPLNSPAFGKSAKLLRQSVAIEKRFEGKEAGEKVPLEDEEWENLNSSVEEPEGGYLTARAKLFLPFMDAVQFATDEDKDAS